MEGFLMSHERKITPQEQKEIDERQARLREQYDRPDVDWEQMLVYDCPQWEYWPRSFAGAMLRGSRLDGSIYAAYRAEILSEIVERFIEFALSDSTQASPYKEWVDRQSQ